MQLPSNSHLPQCLGKLTVQHKEVSQPWANFIQFQRADSLTIYIQYILHGDKMVMADTFEGVVRKGNP